MLLGEDARAAQFKFHVVYDDDFDAVGAYNEQQPGLKFIFHFQRQFTSHLLQVQAPTTSLVQEYIPSFMLTLTAYGSLFLPPVSINARGGMSLITLINIFKLNEGIRQVIPKVAYITMLDIWLEFCFFIIFFINFQFIGVLCLITIEKVKSAQRLEIWSKILVPCLLGAFTLIYSIVMVVFYHDTEVAGVSTWLISL